MTFTKNQTGFYFDESTRCLYSKMGKSECMQDGRASNLPEHMIQLSFAGSLLLFTMPQKYNSCFPSVPFDNPIKTSQRALQLISMCAATPSNETCSAETPIKRRICPWEVNQTPVLSAPADGMTSHNPRHGLLTCELFSG